MYLYQSIEMSYSNFEEMWADYLVDYNVYRENGERSKYGKMARFIREKLSSFSKDIAALETFAEQPAQLASEYFANEVDWVKLLSQSRESKSFKDLSRALELRPEVSDPRIRMNARAVLRDLQRFQRDFSAWLRNYGETRF